MSEQHLLSIDQFCEKYAISRASFYDLEKEHPEILKTEKVPGLERRRFISKDTDQKWEEFIREHNV
tara:strand:+ start:575 stop:772 length:198 start_codon:yes stop_codon:yes gene_type:complete